MMQDKLFELDDTGVDFLNLHQIRCTGHNVGNLAGADTPFSTGPDRHPRVRAYCPAPHGLCPPARNRPGSQLLLPHLPAQVPGTVFPHAVGAIHGQAFEEVTGAGLIRTVQIAADPVEILRAEACLKSRDVDPSLWSIASDRSRMLIAGRLLKTLDPLPAAVKVSYAIATVRPCVTYRNPFREVRLASGGRVVIERSTVYPDMALSFQEVGIFKSAFLDSDRPRMLTPCTERPVPLTTQRNTGIGGA